jgi:uncharacterized protein YecE (DUF72 family)
MDQQNLIKMITAINNMKDFENKEAPGTEYKEIDNRITYLRISLQLHSNNESYNWKDIVVLAEQIRAWAEGGMYLDIEAAWKQIPKEEEGG